MRNRQMVVAKIFPNFSWGEVDTVLLDMDGTLLDKHFDDYFWEVYVPEHYSLLHDISVQEAREQLKTRYKAVENTLDWTDLEYWTRELGLDIPELKMRVNHLIGVHPYVVEFLEFCLAVGKKLYLITNAHSKTLSIKLEKTSIGPWFDRVICAEEVGLAKEIPEFWRRLEDMLGYDEIFPDEPDFEDAVKRFHRLYPKWKENRYGVLAIRFRLLKPGGDENGAPEV